jgi:hypothetical protein
VKRIAVIGALALLLTGCSIFSTRSAESPETGRNTWNTPREPTDVLSNMSSALFERDAINYLKSFDPDVYSFEADQVTIARDPTVSPWNYEMESQHISRLLNTGTLRADSILSVVFTATDQTILSDSAQIRTRYELNAGVSLSGVPHVVAGTADFYLRMGSEGYWQIYRWRDTRTEDQSTWSDFKSLVR